MRFNKKDLTEKAEGFEEGSPQAEALLAAAKQAGYIDETEQAGRSALNMFRFLKLFEEKLYNSHADQLAKFGIEPGLVDKMIQSHITDLQGLLNAAKKTEPVLQRYPSPTTPKQGTLSS